MDESDNHIKPVKTCPNCGAPIDMDILYAGLGDSGFEEFCTKCSWSRVSSFTKDGYITKEKS